MKVQSIKFYRLRNDAYFQYHAEFIDLITKCGAAALGVKPLFDRYMKLHRKASEALNKVGVSVHTKHIHDLDKARNNAWHGMVEVTNAVLKRSASPAVREAARKLKITCDNYGKVARKTLNEKTAAIYNALQELKGTLANEVSAVGVGAWVLELERCNVELGSLVKERFDEAAAKCDVVLRFARLELDEAYRMIVERINARIVLDGISAFEDFARTLNAIISNYRNMKGRHRNVDNPDAI